MDAELAPIETDGIERRIDIINPVILRQIVQDLFLDLDPQQPRVIIDLLDIPTGNDLIAPVDQRDHRIDLTGLDHRPADAKLHLLELDPGLFGQLMNGVMNAFGKFRQVADRIVLETMTLVLISADQFHIRRVLDPKDTGLDLPRSDINAAIVFVTHHLA